MILRSIHQFDIIFT